MTARASEQAVSPTVNAGLPCIRESLKIALHNGGIHSLRLTPNERSVPTNCPLPDEEEMTDYTAALALTHRLEEPPDITKRQHIQDLRRPIRASLLKVVPRAIRDRIAENQSGKTLLAIEISLIDEALERYPWELIGEPGAIYRGARHVTVWRKLVAQGGRPPPKRWRNSLLLTGSTSMRHISPYVERELAAIELGLRATPVAVHPQPELLANALESLLERVRPAAFHLAAHGTEEGLQLQGIPGPTLEELNIIPKVVGAELGNSDVVVGVLNCCNSAVAPYSGGRPGAYLVAELARASIVGMSTIIHPYVAIIFAQAFYACLAAGGSAIQAYYHGTARIRGHKLYSATWSVPVMYSNDADIIPFPVGDEARARLSYQHIQSELGVLDQELEELVCTDCNDPAEWSDQASTPATRMECISSFLPALSGIRPRDATHDGEEVRRAQQELQDALDSASAALDLLGDPECEEEGQNSALGDLYLFRRRHPRILSRLSREFEDAL